MLLQKLVEAVVQQSGPELGAVALQGTKLAPQCSAIDLQSFPTWVINGEKFEGEQTFDKLESLLSSK